MTRRAPFLTPLAASLLLASGAAAQQDPIGDLLGGAPEVAPAPAAPQPVAPQTPAPAQAVELDDDGQPIPPPPEAAPPTTSAEPAPATAAAAAPPPAEAAPQQTLAAPPAEPAPIPPQAVAPPPTAPMPPQQAMTPAPAPPPQAAAAPGQAMPTAPIPYRSLATPPSAQPPLAATPAYTPPPAVPPATSYATPAPAPYASPPAYAPYASPPMGLASAPPPSTNVRPSNGAPVNINERDRTPDSAPTYRELDYEQRLRASYASAQGLQGPLDGTWILSVDGDDLYTMELVDRSSGVLEGVWRDLRRTGSISGSGFVEDIQRYGGQLAFRFQPDTRDAPAAVTLAAGPDGRWTGELMRGGKRKPIILRRN